MSAAKSYSISKLTVWEAFQRVKANRGAAGIDEQSIAQFEQKLQRNLYKVWNRMSSGCMRPAITPCVIKPVATYAATTDRFHSPAASAGV